MQFPTRFITILGHSVFVILLLLSTVFYKERTLYSDMAFYIYKLLQTKTTLIAHGRFVGAIPQYLTVLAIKNMLGLKWVLLTYSWSLILFGYAAFVYCWHFLRSQAFSLVVLMVSIGLYTHAFYWCSSELPLGIVATVVIWAILYERKTLANLSVLDLVLLYGLVPFAVFAHTLILPATLFAGVFFFLEKEKKGIENRLFYSVILAFLGAFIFKMQYMPVDSYDQEASKLAMQNFKTNWYKVFALPSTRLLAKSFLFDYFLLWLLPILFVYQYIKKRAWLKLFIVLGGILGLFCLLHGSYPRGVVQCYIENFYVVLAFCLALPLAIDFLPSLKIPVQWSMAAIVLVCCLRLLSITLAHRTYTDRLTWTQNTIDRNRSTNTKFVLQKSDAPASFDKTTLNWAISYESLLLSALQAPTLAASIYIDENPHRLDWALQKPDALILQYEVIDYKDLNPHYFRFSNSSYQWVK